MKTSIFSILLLLYVTTLWGQTSEEIKADSLRLKKLQLDKAIVEAQNALTNAQDAPVTAEKTAAEAAKQQDLADAKAIKDLLGASLPTPLTGNITFSNNENALAETRVLIYKNLDLLIKKYLQQISDTKCTPLKCNDSSKIVIHNASLYNSLPNYMALIEEIELILKSYETQLNKVQNRAVNNPLTAISVGNEVLKTLLSLSTMFRTETDFRINDEEISESSLVSMLRQRDTCCLRKYYYPTIMPLVASKKSPLLSIIFKIDSVKAQLEKEINTFKQDEKEKLTNKKEGLEKQKAEQDKKISEASASIKPQIQKIIDSLKIEIAKIEKQIPLAGNKFDNDKTSTDTIYDRLRKELFEKDSTTKTTLLNSLLRAEALLDVLKSGAYTLRLSAKGKGTNKVKKFLWRTTLKHSGFVEMEYQLFDAESVLIQADAMYEYSPYTKTKDIK
ncbi:hypothetical protein [Runella salmonicolor]|jgi:hypothetical protein|uniref:Uncharacterized protein n=1 Tax=Runella salmonicolor TaxID=2950278 RepID=A0ABT1FLW7_9BACT|nr:hypothetical protein [Runella salmonicolor]MCP1381543.1 hypothetical protein [Runella salmonicolor]